MNFDILVWLDTSGGILALGQTPKGHAALRILSSEYVEEAIEILCHPDMFMAKIHPQTRVGLMSEDQKFIFEMSKKHLH